MGHHINAAGQFQSDRHPNLGPDKVVLSFKDPQALMALAVLARGYERKDPDFARDIRTRLDTIKTACERLGDGPGSGGPGGWL